MGLYLNMIIEMLFPSPFTCVQPKVAHFLSQILLPILSVSLLHTKWRHVPVTKPEHGIQKTQTYTTTSLIIPTALFTAIL